MGMNLEILNKFDLEKKLEKDIFNDETRRDRLTVFLNTLLEIRVEDRFIRDCPSFPESTKDIFEKELVSAVGATLAIEGTNLGEEEILESFQKADLKQALKQKDQEASNTRDAYTHIIDIVKNRQGNFVYKENDIKDIHEHLTTNIDCVSPNVPGQYRDMRASFGNPRKYSFCRTEDDIEMTMSNFVNWLNKEEQGILSSNPFIKAIMAHYYLTEINPFGDGNGRTARAVEALVLYANGINFYCFWALARFWNLHRDKYLVYLSNIRDTCDPWELLTWGIEGYLRELRRIKGSILSKVRKLMLQDYTRWLLHKKKISKRISGVLMYLIDAGKMPYKQFLSSPQITTLYSNRKINTRYKDFNKMEKDINLIRFSKVEGEKFIEPNFQKLDQLVYSE
ncbi:MAG: Fic family protein [Planctomycetota bacterium]|jgi:Fic family protein